MIVGRVRVQRRRNKDRSATFYSRWTTTGPAGARVGHTRRLFRTGPGLNRSTSATARRKAEAQAYAMEKQLAENVEWPGKDRYLKSSIPKYLWSLKLEDCSDTTKSQRKYMAEHFGRWIRDMRPKRKTTNCVSQKDIAEWRAAWIAAKPRKDGTILTYLSGFQHFLNFGRLNGWWTEPLIAMPRPERKRRSNGVRRPLVLETARLKRILAEQDDLFRHAALFTLAATGMRQGELRSLTSFDWNPEDGILTIPPGVNRNKHHARCLPVGPQTASVLSGCSARGGAVLFVARSGVVLTSQLNAWLRPYDLTPHDLRRWFLSYLTYEGCAEMVVRQLVGHSVGKTTGVYLSEPPVELLRTWLLKVEDALA